MSQIHEQIKRFEQLKRELAVLSSLQIEDEKTAKRIFEELEALHLNPATGRPQFLLIKGGAQ